MFSSRRPATIPPHRAGRRAFTLIELLVVIGILVILMGIGMALWSTVQPASKRATQSTLQQAKSLLNDYQNTVGATAVNNLGPSIYAPFGQDPLQAPQKEGGEAGGLATILTQRVMAQLLTLPANRTTVNQLPSEQTMLLPWRSEMAAVPPSPTNYYRAGDHIFYLGQQYLATADPPDGAIPTAPPWDADPSPVPLLKDAYGNPIIFVPHELDIVDPSNPTTVLRRVTSPENRPFWASAGPDGLFQGDTTDTALTGAEDNIYSFED